MGMSYRYSVFLLSPQLARSVGPDAEGVTGNPEVFLADPTPHDWRISRETLLPAIVVNSRLAACAYKSVDPLPHKHWK